MNNTKKKKQNTLCIITYKTKKYRLFDHFSIFLLILFDFFQKLRPELVPLFQNISSLPMIPNYTPDC